MLPERKNSILRQESPILRTDSGHELIFKQVEILQPIMLPVLRPDSKTHELKKVAERQGHVSTWTHHLIGVKVPSEQIINPEPVLVERADGTDYYLDDPQTRTERNVIFTQFLSLPPDPGSDPATIISLDIIDRKVRRVRYGDGIRIPTQETLETTGVYYECNPNHPEQQIQYSLATVAMTMANGNVQQWSILHQEPFFSK
jgi:hypothetical protein